MLAAIPLSRSSVAQSFLSKQPARLTVAAEPARVAAGRSFTIDLHLSPISSIHVYAPGNPNYIPVAIEILPSPGIKAEPAVLPPGEDILLRTA